MYTNKQIHVDVVDTIVCFVIQSVRGRNDRNGASC